MHRNEATPRVFQKGKRFNIERVPFSAERANPTDERTFRILGGQNEWYWGVPGVFRALASPKGWVPIPELPARSDYSNLTTTVGYWNALSVLLRYRLGWQHPADGLMRWYEQGKPTDDDTLALIAEVWDADGELDDYLAWTLGGHPDLPGDTWTEGGKTYTPQLSPGWAKWLREYRLRSYRNTRVGGPGDSLHLNHHIAQSKGPDPDATWAVISQDPPRGVFQSRAMNSWYWVLRDRMMALPPGARSWRVDAYVRSTGFIGTYRLSGQTGLIFACRHRYHQMGS